MKTGPHKPLTGAKASELLWSLTQEVVAPVIAEIGEKPLDFAASEETAALAQCLAKIPGYDIRAASPAAIRLLFARLTCALSYCTLQPDEVIAQVPAAAPDGELLGFLLLAEIARMKLPEQERH